MGGPWRERGFDPTAWRPPAAHGGDVSDAIEPRGRDRQLASFVLAYVVSAVTSIGVLLVLLKSGW